MTFYMAMHTERSRLGVCNYPPCTAVEVETASCDALVGAYRPMYVKIDAEGADIVCLSAIFHGIASGSLHAPPRYISVEELLTQEMYDAAGNAGYTHFKYADQRNNHGGANHGAGTGAFRLASVCTTGTRNTRGTPCPAFGGCASTAIPT